MAAVQFGHFLLGIFGLVATERVIGKPVGNGVPVLARGPTRVGIDNRVALRRTAFITRKHAIEQRWAEQLVTQVLEF